MRRKNDESAGQGVNYNTRALGRTGYFSVNLLTSQGRFEQDKYVAITLLDSPTFMPGHRHEDFISSTDHVAEYGLAALIGVVAAKKLGLLALAGVFLAKFAKIGAFVVAGVGAVIARVFKRREAST